jgi:hypothetical protein
VKGVNALLIYGHEAANDSPTGEPFDEWDEPIDPRTDRSRRAVARIADAGNIYLTMMDRKRPKRLRRPQRFSDC